MSATVLRDLLVRLGIEDGDESLSQAEALDSALSDLAATMAVVVTAGAAIVTTLAAVAVSAATAGDEVAEGAIRAGIATDAYQELTYAAGQSGVEVTQLEQALAKQSTSLAELQDGTEAQVEAYEALGLSAADLEGMSTDEAFLATADAIASMTDEQDQLQAATAIYGSELAAKLMPLLGEGSAGLEALAAEAQALGLVMSEEDIEAAAGFSDALDAAYEILLSLRNEIGLELLPILTEWLLAVKTWVASNRELIDTKIEEWVGKIVAGLVLLEEAGRKVDDVVTTTFGGWEPLLEKAAALVAVIGAAFAGWGAVSVIGSVGSALAALVGFLGTTLGAVLLAVGALVGQFVLWGLVLEDVWTFIQGGDSAIGRFIEQFRSADGIMGTMVRTAETLFGVLGTLVNIVTTLGGIWYSVFSVTLLPVLEAIGGAVLWVAQTWAEWWVGNVGTALTFVATLLDSVMEKINAFLPVVNAAVSAVGALFGVSGEATVSAETSGATTSAATTGAASTSDLFGSTSSAFAPTSTEATAGTTTGAAATSTTNVTQGGNSYVVNGVGWTEEDILALISQAEAEKARQTSAALAGAEV